MVATHFASSEPASSGPASAGEHAGRRPTALCLLLLALLSALACAPPRPQIKTVVLIVVDTLRADHLSLYGYERQTSPHLDLLARDAVVFENGLATSSWTLPSFASLLTGYYQSTHRAGLQLDKSDGEVNGKANRTARLKVETSLPTIAEELRDAGFETAAFVNNPWLKPALGIDRGFDHFHKGSRDQTRGDHVVTRVLEWLDGPRQERFFLVVHLIDPHMSYDAPPPARGTFTDSIETDIELPVENVPGIRLRAARFSSDRKEFMTAAYDEEILFVDQQLDRLFQDLDDRGLLQNSLIVLTSDHGEELFDHGKFEHGHSMYQELLNVPFIIWAPTSEPRRAREPVSLVDIAPTIREAVGLPKDPNTPGLSLLPFLLGEKSSIEDRTLFAEGELYGPRRRAAIRWPQKLVVTERSTKQREFFNLDDDSEEQNELSQNQPAAVADLARAIAALKTSVPLSENTGEVPLDEQTLRELRSVGYVQ